MARYFHGKRIGTNIYTQGKFGKRWREITDIQNPFLYSYGIYPTKITKEDLPEDYIEINSRVIWYMTGYLRTAGIVDLGYTWVKENHLFKDDYIYISYHGPLKEEISNYGRVSYEDYDCCVCGNDIVDIVCAAEKYSGFDTSKVRAGIEAKRIWLRDNEAEYYKRLDLEDRDIFEQWKDKGYINIV